MKSAQKREDKKIIYKIEEGLVMRVEDKNEIEMKSLNEFERILRVKYK